MSLTFLTAMHKRAEDNPSSHTATAINIYAADLSDPDTVSLICGQLITAELLALASTSTTLQELCNETLERDLTLRLRGPEVTGANLLRLVKDRMRGGCKHLDVTGCDQVTKASVVEAVAASPSLVELVALRCGPGAWTTKPLAKLLEVAPPALHARLDARLELKNDLQAGSSLLASLGHPTLHVERLVLVADNQTRAEAGADTASVAAALEAANALDASAVAADEAEEDAAPATEASAALQRLACALSQHHAHLEELDASSGALGQPGATQLLLAPLLSPQGSRLRSLKCTHLAQGAMRTLAPALHANRTLRSLELVSNMFLPAAATLLATALEGHATLTRLNLNHNPILDVGAVALVSVLPTTPIQTLSLAFTGAADGACAALGLVLSKSSGKSSLLDLNLTGNRVTATGAASLAAALASGASGLRSLTLTANVLMDGEATSALAKALPAAPSLRSLTIAGCNVDKRACARLAAVLPQSATLTALDVSSNHFAGGSDELAWALPNCEALRELNLADCALGDDEADELLEALGVSAGLASLDLRWNRLNSGHAISKDTRVNMAGQKGASAAERGAKEAAAAVAAAAAKGKKVYRPKWQRDMKVTQGGGAA
jgi:Ran GTPase-activating protein (RanGAP) involved in mRNA processing and transport